MEKRRGDKWGLIIGFIALIFAGALLGLSEQGRQVSAPPGSSYGITKDGLSGIYAVLEKQQAALRWTLPLDRLTGEVERIVIWDVGMVEEQQITALMDWVDGGGVAILGGDIANIGQTPPQGKGTGETAHPSAAAPITLNINQIDVGPVRWEATGNQLVHLVDEEGLAILLSRPHGRGRIYSSADTEWLQNQRIGKAQNLELALALLLPAEGKKVAFDEYHHGFQSATRWWQILRGPLQTFLLVLTAAVALLYWAYGARFGSPRPTPPGPPRAAVEYVYSMSQLYRRAQARKMVLQALYRSITLELGRLLGGTRGLTHAQIAERTAHRARVRPEVIENLLNRIDPDQRTAPSEAELIKLARETEELQRRMQNAEYRDQRDAGKGSI